MVVAPLTAGNEVFGAIGTFSRRVDAFDAAEIALVRSLADHAAAAMANSRLIEELDRSRSALAERAEVERTLREISVRLSAASDLSDVLQQAVDEAARLLHADGARIDLVDGRLGLLRGAYASGAAPARRDRLARRSRRDPGPGRLGPGRRHRPTTLDRRLRRRTTASRTGPAPTPTSGTPASTR